MDYRWDDVRLFLALLRAGTFSGAADALGVNVSTASRRLQAFEEAVGARLFDRTPDGLVPTSAAERLVPAAERTEEAALEVARALQGVERTPTGRVRLNALPGLTEHFLGPFMERLAARHPGIRLQLDSVASVVDLTRNEADLALRTVRPQSGDLVMKQVAAVEYVLVASPALAERLGVVEDPKGLPFAAWSPHLAETPPARWWRAHAPGSEPVVESDNLAIHLHAARAGLGVALLPRQYLAVVGGLAELPLSDALRSRAPLPTETLWLVGHRALRDVPRIAAVWELLVEYFGEG